MIDVVRRKNILFEFAIILITICIIILPMGLCPIWNGEIPESRNQYEALAESIIERGSLELNYEVDPRLKNLENPYDPIARESNKVDCSWDTAYYKGHYYMYFGVVPVLLLFIPFRLITGSDLTTFHATQFFTACFIVGLFLLIHKVSLKYFKKLNSYKELFLGVTFSIISSWYNC